MKMEPMLLNKLSSILNQQPQEEESEMPVFSPMKTKMVNMILNLNFHIS